MEKENKKKATNNKISSKIQEQKPNAYKLPYQLKNKKWEIHIYDSDFFPSVPHGHSGKYKLDIYTGAIFDINTGFLIGYLSKKELEKLLNDKKVQNAIIKARTYYLNRNPRVILPKINFNLGKNKIYGNIHKQKVYSISNILNKNLNMNYKFHTTVNIFINEFIP